MALLIRQLTGNRVREKGGVTQQRASGQTEPRAAAVRTKPLHMGRPLCHQCMNVCVSG